MSDRYKDMDPALAAQMEANHARWLAEHGTDDNVDLSHDAVVARAADLPPTKTGRVLTDEDIEGFAREDAVDEHGDAEAEPMEGTERDQ